MAYISRIKDDVTGEVRDLKDREARQMIKDLEDIVSTLAGVDGGHLATDNDIKHLQSQIDDVVDETMEISAEVDHTMSKANETIFKAEQIIANQGYSGSNPNLLINGDFRINQRKKEGQESYTELNKYTVDRWKIGGQNGVVVKPKKNGGVNIKVTSTWSFVSYKMEEKDYIALRGKTVTLSCYVSNIVSNVSSLYLQISGGGSSNSHENITISNIGLHSLTFTFPTDVTTCEIRIAYVTNATSPNVDIDFDYVKLELGSVATPFSPRPYAEELALCQLYYKEFFNVSLAPTDLYISANRLQFGKMRTSPSVKIYPADISGNQVNETEKAVYNIATGTIVNISKNGEYITDTQMAITGTFIQNTWYGYIVKIDAEIY